jgi:membrane protease YdiL (CAAX protease family)
VRAFAIFTGLIFLGLAGIAVLGYPAWLVMSPWLDHPKFHRIASRVGMLLLTVGFIIVVRRLKMADRQSLGFALPAREFVAQVFKSLVFGVVLMMPALVTMLLLDMRELVGEPLSAMQWVRLSLSGLITGLTISLIEETFLRGAMQFAITRESGARVAIVLTSLVYAATHFIGRYRVAAADVDAGSGLDMLAYALADFARPYHFIDAFLCLVAIGVVLGMARAYTGNIAACIGLHSGWVAVIYVVHETSRREPSSPLKWMLSDVNGFLGWLVLAWTLVIGVALYFWYRKRPQRKIPW